MPNNGIQYYINTYTTIYLYVRYNKQSITNNDMNTLIELWRLDNVLDGYGVNQSTEVKVMDVYASVRNVNKYRQMKYNEMGYQSNVDITFRYVSDRFDFIKINGTEYTINDINNRDNLSDWIDITAYASNSNKIRQ